MPSINIKKYQSRIDYEFDDQKSVEEDGEGHGHEELKTRISMLKHV